MGRLKSVALAAAVSVTVSLVGVVSPVAAEGLRIGVMAQPTAMDPHFHNLTPNNSTLSHVYERLVETAPDGTDLPGLAESWKLVDPLTWEFKLRANVKWHDGKPFTADDVVFTFQRAPNVPNSPSGFGSAIKGKTIKKIDDLTVQISTPDPFPLMPTTMSNVMIVSKAVGEGAKTEDYNSGKAAIGTGPYKFGAFVPDDRVEVLRNDAHWAGKPQWDKITFKPIKAGPARVAALLAGDVDMIEDVPTADIERMKKDEKLTLVQAVSRRVIYFHLDHWRDVSPFIKGKDGAEIKNPLKDLRVRQALSKAINREAIVSRVMEGAALPASQFLAEQFFGTSKDLKVTAYDPEGAKKLLEAAGYPNGFKMTIHGPNGRYANDVKIIEAVAQMYTRIGVETTIETLPPSVFFTRASSGAEGKPEFSFILVGWSTDTGETSASLRPLVGTYDKDKGAGTTNRGRYSNPELDKMIEEALRTTDDKKRAEMLAKASEVAIYDLAIIPIQYPLSTWALKKGLTMKGRADEYTLGMNVTVAVPAAKK